MTSATAQGVELPAQSSSPSSPPPATPIVFGPEKRRLFGWLHPAGGDRRGCGVVLCNPLGIEALRVHRSYRIFAEQLAAAGFPALRFDYDGTGNSAGRDEDPGRVEAWRASVGFAIDELRTQAGVPRVALFGVRLGATLAMLAGAGRHEVEALILWAPIQRGRAYLHELRAFELMKEGAPPSPPGILEISGFVLTQETLADLTKLDLFASGPKLPETLVLSRDDLAAEAPLVKHLVQGGAKVTLIDLPGYAAMMQDPHEAQVPLGLFAAVIDWLAVRCDRVAAEMRAVPIPGAELRAELDGVRERALRFGTPGHLFGILSEPQRISDEPTHGTAILLLNVGANHHIGPNRMWVTLARRLGRAGFRVFRFDVAGIGESPASPGTQENQLYNEASNADVQTAINQLVQTEGVSRFVLVGLCSGAFLAFHTTLADPRVVGQVLINMPTFHWKEGDSLQLSVRKGFKSSGFYLRGLLRGQMWTRLAGGKINVRGIAGVFMDRWLQGVKDRLGSWLPNPPLVEGVDVLNSFKTIAERGTDSLLLYSAEDGGLDEIERHIGRRGARMRSRPNFLFKTLEGADHTFSPLVTRELLFETIQRHLEQRFG